MTRNSRNVKQSAAVPGGVLDVIFYMSGTVGFQNQGFGAERCNNNVVEDVLWVNLLILFKIKISLRYYVHIHSFKSPEDWQSEI